MTIGRISVVNLWRNMALIGIVSVALSMVDAAIANAYDTVDYGTNRAACMAAEKQLKASGIRYASCYETGPGHYSLAWDD